MPPSSSTTTTTLPPTSRPSLHPPPTQVRPWEWRQHWQSLVSRQWLCMGSVNKSLTHRYPPSVGQLLHCRDAVKKSFIDDCRQIPLPLSPDHSVCMDLVNKSFDILTWRYSLITANSPSFLSKSYRPSATHPLVVLAMAFHGCYKQKH
jgi:hypothetical protein